MDGLYEQRRYLIPFRSSLLPQIFTDVLVIGAGVAGLRGAIAAAEGGAAVIVVCKEGVYDCNTATAQGGIASALHDSRDVEEHIRDTVAVGSGLCDQGVVRRVVEDGPRRLEELIGWGLRLDKDPQGQFALGREGGHSAARIYHAFGDATGREIERCLLERLRGLEQVRLFEKCFTLDLITAGEGKDAAVVGAITHHPRYGLQMIWAQATILAAGGGGQIYRETTNPRTATADGVAMAYRAGAAVADMAFVQFHPTTLYLPGAPRSLISEAVRGEGAYLIDAADRRFLLEVDPRGELAPRDVVSRAIVRHIGRQGGRNVFLDCRHISGVNERFPSIAAELKRFELDPARDLIPVHPAAHYMVGGVRADGEGHTNLPGLWAVGEVSCSGLHGANRLASNSLLEGLVMGAAAGGAAAAEFGAAAGGREGGGKPLAIVSDIRPSDTGELDLEDVRSSLRSAMWRNVGIERTGVKLNDAIHMLDFWARYTLDKIFDEPSGWETQNMLLAAALMARSAAWREESRGCHARGDFAEARDDFAVHDVWQRGEQGPRQERIQEAAK